MPDDLGFRLDLDLCNHLVIMMYLFFCAYLRFSLMILQYCRIKTDQEDASSPCISVILFVSICVFVFLYEALSFFNTRKPPK